MHSLISILTSKIRLAQRFFQYYRKATTVYKIHSPFLYRLADSILEDERSFYPFIELETLRHKALRDNHKLSFEDLGAGSASLSVNKQVTRSVSQIAQTAVSNPGKCRILFRIVLWRKPGKMLEIGTSLGIATLYQYLAARNAKMITLEGISAISAIARLHFSIFNIDKINLLTGHFNDTLPGALKELQELDYAFIDGNHRKEPVLNYFHQCLDYSNENTVIVIDDIYWSDEMAEAWEMIKANPKATCTIDLFKFGIVLFSKNDTQIKHHTWIKARYKPWLIGLKS